MLNRLSLPVLFGLVVLALAAACGGGDDNTFKVKGRTLEIVFEKPVITKRAFFINDGTPYVIEVADPSTRIVALKMTVVNWKINITKLRVGTDSVAIGSGGTGEKHGALVPFERATEYTGEIPDEELFTPLLWDDFELRQGFQASGWIFFEVPVGLELDSLWWSAADDIIGRF